MSEVRDTPPGVTSHLESMNVVGTRQRRLDGDSKVTGTATYTADLRVADFAHTALFLSPYAHAKITSVDLSAVREAPGVLLALSGADLPRLHAAEQDQALARERVIYAGQPVVAVVATTREQAEDAIGLVEIEWEPMPPITNTIDAVRPEAQNVLEQSATQLADVGAHGMAVGEQALDDKPPNVTSLVRMQTGDCDASLAAAAVVVREAYVIPGVHQGFLEPHAAAARAEPSGRYTIWTSTQGQFLTRQQTAEMLGIPVSSIRVVPSVVGGGFGGKVVLLEPLAALLAERVGQPVLVELTRNQEFLMGRGGPGAVIELKLGADSNGRLVGAWVRAHIDDGAGPGGLAGFLPSFFASYRIPNLDYVGYDIATNKTPVTAYRAPGSPQAHFALESALDELARSLEIDPIDFRLQNAARQGDPRADGTPYPPIGLIEVLEQARHHELYTAPKQPHEGIGVAVGSWGGGREPAAAACRVESDGSLTLQLGSVDISGTDTGLAMIAAEVFGVPLEKVRVESSDTGAAPYAGMAGGSKIVYTVGPAVMQAAAEARRQLLDIAAEELEASPGDLTISRDRVVVKGVPTRSMGIGELAHLGAQFGGRYPPVYGHGRTAVRQQSPMFTVHIARVIVDPETGDWKLTGYVAIQDVGRAINPAEIEGQIHGGSLQGLGRALGEELRYDDDGQLRTATFADYPLPSIDQAPEVQVQLVEVPSPFGPLGAKGVGEPPAIPGPAAVANAIRDACGVRATSLPISPEDIWRAISTAKRESSANLAVQKVQG